MNQRVLNRIVANKSHRVIIASIEEKFEKWLEKVKRFNLSQILIDLVFELFQTY